MTNYREILRLHSLGLNKTVSTIKGVVCILSSKNPWFCQSKFLGIATGIPW